MGLDRTYCGIDPGYKTGGVALLCGDWCQVYDLLIDLVRIQLAWLLLIPLLATFIFLIQCMVASVLSEIWVIKTRT